MSKNRNKKKKAAVRPPVKATRVYVSECHGVQAQKSALTALPDYKTAAVKDFGGLGKFRCSQCGKRCKVRVQKAEATVA